MDFHKLITDELSRRGLSVYAFGKQACAAGICNEQTVYRYLADDGDTYGDIIGPLLSLLDFRAGGSHHRLPKHRDNGGADFRSMIRAEIDRQGRRVGWLSMMSAERDVCSESAVYYYLQGKRDTTGGVIGALFEFLGLEVHSPALAVAA